MADSIDTMLSVSNGIAKGSLGHDVIFCLEEEKFYIYQNGYWKQLADLEMMSLILNKYSGDNNLADIRYYTVSRRRQILDNLKMLVFKRLDVFNRNGYLNFDLGEFDPMSGYMHNHNKDNYSTLRMGYPYHHSAKCDLWIKTLDEIFEGDKDKIDILQEFFGYCLTRDTRKEKALLLLGESRCLGGETLIYNPVTNESIPVSEIKNEFYVNAWDGKNIVVAKAEKPFKKDIDKLYTVELSNGQSFVCSMSHLILTSSGYLPLRELRVGSEAFLPSTTSDNGQTIHPLNENRYYQKAVDSQSYYHSLFRFYGVPLQNVLNNVLNVFPLQDDALQHINIGASVRTDGQGSVLEYNHAYQFEYHPSTSDARILLKSPSCRLLSVSYKIYESALYRIQALLQSMSKTFHSQPISESFLLDNHFCSIFPYKPPSLVITSIAYKRDDFKWDFTVPKYHNYICAGAVHHNTGKSTILETLTNMIGKKNCSFVALDYICHPQYSPLLMNKLVNIDTDVSAKAENFEREFKTITSGEPLTCNQKFVETFDFNPYCKLVMAANEFPSIKDHSKAFYKRLILLPCDRVFKESDQNIQLKDLLALELSGIFNWAVEGLNRLNKRGSFENKEFMTKAINELRLESNPIERFFEEFIVSEVSDDNYIEKGPFYEKYKAWCQANNHYTLNQARFSQAVYRKYSEFTPKTTHINNVRIWRNLKYKDEFNKQSHLGWVE